MEKSSMYGHYTIEADYRGKHVKTMTTDSEAWDWIEDGEDKEKQQDARRHCYYKIVEAYEGM